MLKYAPLFLSAIAVPALTQTPAPAPQVAQAKPNPLDKMVCRTEETLGSRLRSHKVCATVREWQEQQQENRDAVELIQQKGQAVVPSN